MEWAVLSDLELRRVNNKIDSLISLELVANLLIADVYQQDVQDMQSLEFPVLFPILWHISGAKWGNNTENSNLCVGVDISVLIPDFILRQ